ncbi:MAG: hypothetical protein U0793_07595 [Gemmataceae bacterium]
MRSLLRYWAAAAAVALIGMSTALALSPASKPATCGEYGTSIQFEKSPSDAAKKALKEEKLVMVLHISGYFEDPDFT